MASNGSISFGSGTSDYDEPLPEILRSSPGICVYCIDLENYDHLTDAENM